MTAADDLWIDVVVVAIRSNADIVEARAAARQAAARLGFSATDSTLLATAISELARNIVEHAHRGTMSVSMVHDGRRCGVQVVATDDGPGVPDVERAMQDGYSTARSLGLGLPGARRLMDDFHIESRPGDGTTVKVRKWSQTT